MILGRLLKFGFSNKLALISGAPKYDHEVSTIARTLKRVAGDSPVSIVGAVSDEYAESFSNIYASSSLLDNYEFEVTRAYNSYHEDIQDCRVMPYRIYTHYKNHQFIKELERKNFFQNVFENGIEAVATVGNFSLALRIGEKLNEVPVSLYSTAANLISPNHLLHYSIDNTLNAQYRMKSSLIINTTMSKKPQQIVQVMCFHLIVWDMKGFMQFIAIFNNSEEILKMTCSILKILHGSKIDFI
jgi:hypothetical protein